MTTLVLIAALALGGPLDQPRAAPPAPAPAAPAEEEPHIRVLQLQLEALKLRTAEAMARTKLALLLLDAVKTPWTEALAHRAIDASGQALFAEIRVINELHRARMEVADRVIAELNRDIKLSTQHIAMYDGYAALRGIRAIAAYHIDPVAERFLGPRFTLPPLPAMPPLPTTPIK